MAKDLPYSGGAQGPSPLATRSPIMLYHSSLDLPLSRAMTIIVMLSHPTPPVSLFDAKQLSIMFSQIECSSCFAAIPRLTNSTTACEDWQSQIPASISHCEAILRSGTRTIAGDDEELVVISELVNRDVGECRDNLLFGRQVGALLELKVSDGPAQREVAVDSTEIDKATCRADPRFLAFVLRLVVERQRFRSAFNSEYRSRVARVALRLSGSLSARSWWGFNVRRRSCRA